MAGTEWGSEMTRPTDKNRRNLYIKQEDYDYLAQIGNGNVSKGIREAVKLAKEAHTTRPIRPESPVG